MGSADLIEVGIGDSLEGSDNTPMYNPHIIPLRLEKTGNLYFKIFQKLTFAKLLSE